jgi:hypothetical protein
VPIPTRPHVARTRTRLDLDNPLRRRLRRDHFFHIFPLHRLFDDHFSWRVAVRRRLDHTSAYETECAQSGWTKIHGVFLDVEVCIQQKLACANLTAFHLARAFSFD